MGKESSDVFRFDLGLLLQGQMNTSLNLQVLITHLLLDLQVNVKPIYHNFLNSSYFLKKCCLSSRNRVSCQFPVDTSCIWPQIRPWSSS